MPYSSRVMIIKITYQTYQSFAYLKFVFFGRPQEVVIFVVGGTTYEESRSVFLQNSTNSGIRFILGGTAVLNSKR